MPQTNRSRNSPMTLSGISLENPSTNRRHNNVSSSRKSGQMENRLHKAEQSNRTLLDELMRVQNEMRISTKRYLEKIEDEKQFRKQMESSLQKLQSQMAQTEEKLRRSDQAAIDTKNQLSQLVDHTKGVERAISNQDTARGDASFNYKMEKQTLSLRTELQELENKLRKQDVEISSLKNKGQQELSGTNSDLRIRGIEKQFLEECKERKASEKLLAEKMEQLDSQIQKFKEKEQLRIVEEKYKLGNPNSNGKEEKLKSEILRRISDLEKKTSNEKLKEQAKFLEMENLTFAQDAELEKKLAEFGEKFNAMKSEVEKVIALEIKNRKESDQIIMKKVNECRDNLHLGMTAIQEKKFVNGTTNWKLDAVKVHEISQECADEVRMELDKDMQQFEKTVSNMRTEIINQKKEYDARLLQLEKLKTSKSAITAPPVVAQQISNKDSNYILGSEIDRQLDEMTFFQERVRIQMESVKNDVHTLREKNIKSLEDNVSNLDRKFTARIDSETRVRTKNVEDMSVDIAELKKRPVVQPTEQLVTPKDIKHIQDETSKFQSSVKKLAESIKIVKDTLTDKIQEESIVRKEETEQLRIGVNQVNKALKSLKDDI